MATLTIKATFKENRWCVSNWIGAQDIVGGSWILQKVVIHGVPHRWGKRIQYFTRPCILESLRFLADVVCDERQVVGVWCVLCFTALYNILLSCFHMFSHSWFRYVKSVQRVSECWLFWFDVVVSVSCLSAVQPLLLSFVPYRPASRAHTRPQLDSAWTFFCDDMEVILATAAVEVWLPTHEQIVWFNRARPQACEVPGILKQLL